MNEPPPFSNWKDAWEWYAEQTAQHFARHSEAQLLEWIAAGQYDPYYQIWYSLRETGSLKTCAPVLLQVLRRETGEENMLIRYHCAAALFFLLGYPDEPLPELRTRAQWDHHGEEARQQAINDLENLIRAKLIKMAE